MSAIKDGRFPIMLDKERHILFSLNVIDALEDRIGNMDALAEKMNEPGRMKLIRWLFTLLLEEGTPEGEEPLTEKQVGKLIHAGNMKEIQEAIFQSFRFGRSGTTEPTEGEEEDEDAEDGEEGKNIEAGEVE